MKIIGIDTGREGAIAILQYPPLKIIDIFNFPLTKIGNRTLIDAHLLNNILSKKLSPLDDIACIIEKVDGILHGIEFHKGISKRIFSFGVYYGITLSVISQWTPVLVLRTAQSWRRKYTKTKWKGSKKQQKNISCKLATTLFPQSKQMLIRKRVIDHNRAEALLIAYSYLL